MASAEETNQSQPDPLPGEEPISPSGTPHRVRLSVDLEGDVVNRLDEIRRKRGLSKSQAVRRALSLLALLDEDRYELILRDKEGQEPDRSIILVP